MLLVAYHTWYGENVLTPINYKRYDVIRIKHKVLWGECTKAQEHTTSFILPIPSSIIFSIADAIAPSDTGSWHRTTHKVQEV
jgi:hypothetical protein